MSQRTREDVAVTVASAPGRRTMCVRTCDGYLFPVGTLHSRDDLDIHQTACNAACPGAETQLYTLSPGQGLENPSAARSVVDGTVYGRMKTAFLFRRSAVPSCECQPAGRFAHLPILLDPTLRRGDVVVDGKGEAKAFTGPARRREAFGDYERSPALSRSAKVQVDRLMGTSVRRKIAADYERGERLRLAAASGAVVHVVDLSVAGARPVGTGGIRETAPPAGTKVGVRAYTFGPGRTVHASGATIIAVQ